MGSSQPAVYSRPTGYSFLYQQKLKTETLKQSKEAFPHLSLRNWLSSTRLFSFQFGSVSTICDFFAILLCLSTNASQFKPKLVSSKLASPSPRDGIKY